MSDRPPIRRAREADLPGLGRMLSRAFLDDPVASWAYRPDRLRPAALERFQTTRLRQLLKDEEVWTNDELTCAARWAPPNSWRQTPREEVEIVGSFVHPLLLYRVPMLLWGWHGLERHHKALAPHWYLAVLGTEPSAQGRGLGSAVLAGVLDQCDSDGVGAYLESSKESNIDFYARHGFRVLEEIRLTRGPSMWTMWRDPRP
jgi:GNAT superfamily N-acetyltransferase